MVTKLLRSSLRAWQAMRAIGPEAYLRYKWHGLQGTQKRVSVDVNGYAISVRAGAPDLEVAMASLGDEYRALSRVLPGDFDGLIVDAGAYIGTASLRLARMYPRATVIAIEPSSENHAVLVENTRGQSNILCVKAALSVEGRSPVKLRNRGTGQWGYTVVQSPLDRPAAAEMEEVEIVSLEQIQERHPDRSIGILKLDIEGAEKELFDSRSELLASVPVIMVELHDRVVAGCSASFNEFSKERWIICGSGEKFLSLQRVVR